MNNKPEPLAPTATDNRLPSNALLGSVKGLRIREEDENSVWATYKRHDISCTHDQRREGQWQFEVRNRAGETIATGHWQGVGRLAMIEKAMRAAELLPNTAVRHAADKP